MSAKDKVLETLVLQGDASRVPLEEKDGKQHIADYYLWTAGFLRGKKKADLKKMCRQLKLALAGNVEDLTSRILQKREKLMENQLKEYSIEIESKSFNKEESNSLKESSETSLKKKSKPEISSQNVVQSKGTNKVFTQEYLSSLSFPQLKEFCVERNLKLKKSIKDTIALLLDDSSSIQKEESIEKHALNPASMINELMLKVTLSELISDQTTHFTDNLMNVYFHILESKFGSQFLYVHSFVLFGKYSKTFNKMLKESKKPIFAALNYENHWNLICFHNSIVFVYESLFELERNKLLAISGIVKELAKGSKYEGSVIQVVTLKQQKDGYSCGHFVCIYASLLSMNFKIYLLETSVQRYLPSLVQNMIKDINHCTQNKLKSFTYFTLQHLQSKFTI